MLLRQAAKYENKRANVLSTPRDATQMFIPTMMQEGNPKPNSFQNDAAGACH